MNEFFNSILAIDPFLLSYFLGLAILLFFVRERLDVPSPSKKTASGTGGMVQQFVSKLPPSSVRVTRYFMFACFVYFVGLAIFYTVICMLFALGAKGLLPQETGFSPDRATVGLQPGAAAPPQLDNGFLNVLMGLVTRDSDISQHPWNPLVMALGMIGLLPSLPYVARFENWTRRLSLWVVGIPSSVVDLWKSLRKVDVDPILEEYGDERTIEHVKSLGRVYGRFTGDEDQATKFREQMAKITAYSQISQKWPEEEIKSLFQEQAPPGLDDDTGRIMIEALHLHSLSLTVESAVPKIEEDTAVGEARAIHEIRPAAVVAGPGFGESRSEFTQATPPEPTEALDPEQETTPERATEDIVAESRRILKKRWKEVAKQLSGADEGKPGQVDLCCLMMSLFAERSRSLSPDVTPPVALEWIRKARDAQRSTASSLNLFLFASFVALLFASVVMFLLGSVAEGSLEIAIPAGNSLTQVILSMVFRLIAMLLPAVPAVYMVRATLDRELHWRPWTEMLVPRMLQYVMIAALAFLTGTVAHLLYLFIDPYLAGNQNQIIPFSEILALPNVVKATLAALAGTAFAVILSLTFDQEERKTNRSFNLSMLFLGSLLSLSLAFVLFFDPLYHDVKLAVIDDRLIRWLMTIGVGLIVFAFAVASIRKRRSIMATKERAI